MIKKYISLLFEPFPDEVGMSAFIKHAIIAAFVVFLVLAVLQPIGFSNTPSPIREAMVFGIITGVVLLIFEVFVSFVLKLDRESPKWVFWHWLLLTLSLITCIAIANYFYVVYRFGQSFSGSHFFSIWTGTMIVGTIPTLVFGGLRTIRMLKVHGDIASSLGIQKTEESIQKVILQSKLQSEKPLEIEAKSLLYIQAQQNYVQVYWIKDGVVVTGILRTTLTQIEQETPEFIFRCHRSFAVNKLNILSAEGNAQGLQLTLEGLEGMKVPVSRKYVSQFR